MNLKQTLNLIAEGNIIALKFKGSDEIIIKDYKDSDVFEVFMKNKVNELNSKPVINEYSDEVIEFTVELER
ncbi:hypothetical protein N42HA_01435 [Lactococcus lactis]|uniref:Uncharacterized protein n=1 Tax=Lactococcus lactis subsp. lactis TaxID=1360 RepID=A0A0V8EQP4_LACLL|nr:MULTISPECIES: hypothetical protein [Lactococcus]MDU0408422.1 hypothetical protein [Lactococcus lactis]SJN52149.1 hypothetical protein FM120_34260 [Sphingobacterium faecium PCAi_F2.5]KSU27817.1 hypothetical protein N42_0830 [Lactococcus lactis subsp. lactis]KZK07175.1 hypothetical protein V4_1768 [Lactococcus cremoris]MDU8932105.1 hypothetical protein [Lactococcus cremoris]